MDSLRYAASLFFDPLALLSWALIALNVLLWRRPAAGAAQILCGLVTGVLFTAACPFVANELQGALEDHARALHTCPPPPPGSTLVVLAGGVNGAPRDAQDVARLNDATYRRTVAAVRMATGVPHSTLLMSGGAGGQVREADLMQSLAIALGVSPDRVRVERESRSTYGNAEKVKPLLQAASAHPVYLVTSAMHMRRAAATFESSGLPVCAYPVDFQRAEPEWAEALVPRLSAMQKTAESLREVVAYWGYQMQKRIVTK